MGAQLSDKKQTILLATLEANDGNVAKTARETDFSAPTIRKYRDAAKETDSRRKQKEEPEPEQEVSEHDLEDDIPFVDTEEVTEDELVSPKVSDIAKRVAEKMRHKEIERVQIARLIGVNRLIQILPLSTQIREIAGAIKILDDLESNRHEQGRIKDSSSGGLGELLMEGLEQAANGDTGDS